ncbi:unnamed protein product [Adineta steineri]|uniref:Uncharacterized protein n=1 Tax=Adineta steineri TaxID=433720 RepID=A0A819BH41_9BILA|nr:unnamed protein product [Adineta steineri]CAF3801374.1 unnamed protein product [Adineta steineri]
MLQRQLLTGVILFITIIKYVDNFQIFINNTKFQNIESSLPYSNKSYEIPLFQTHYITIRTYTDDFYNISHVIGFKFQIKSTNSELVTIRKENTPPIETATDNGIENNVLREDLYILPRKKALGHIFNAYFSPTIINLNQSSAYDLEINSIWLINGNTMGLTNLTFRLDVFYDDDTSITHSQILKILISQPKRRIDTIFYIIMPIIVTGISIIMGVLLETEVIKSILKKPTPVLVGFVAQYGLMPFLAIAIAKLFHYTPLYSLALFVIGCCPGSGASNQWTVIFDGDVNLSAVMSIMSTVASFIMMPIYFSTLGTIYMDELKIKIPFWVLLRSLAIVVVPYAFGICISHFYPKSRLFVKELIKPIMICIMIFFLAFGTMVHWYLLKMIDLYTILTAPLLPFLGFLFGALLAWISRLSWTHIKTIGIEAGIQNTGVAFMIIFYSFPQPYASQAAIVPMIVAFLTTKPFWIILIIRNQIRKYKKRKELAKTSNVDGELTISYHRSSLNTEENIKTDNVVENMQKL